MTIKNNFIAPIIYALCLCTAPLSNGQEQSTATSKPEAKGLSIAKEMKARDRGWVDNSAEMEMVLHSGKRESRREMRVLSLEVIDDGDKSMTIFDSPNDIKGTAFLSFTHPNAMDDQWLYLPALKRVKRIASKNKSGPFMGSEFAYEDLNSFEVEQYDYRWLRDETLDGQDCFVVESIPRDEYSGYSKQISWIDKTHYRALKIDFYDRKDTLLKTLTLSDYQLHLDKFWRPTKQSMLNHKNQRRTEVYLRNYQFGTGLDESDFTENSLKRAR
ncbi:outer membrane lipoprotein-sorting protein [Zhongshania sp.]|uniref:outer membrane lipoprotein-sorting protein n=1 Tax=Zhongshania sp. TaxID=1971902 RepID=UPI0035644D17